MSIIYNCHTHIFNIKCAPDKFLNLFIGNFFGKAVMKLLRKALPAKVFVNLLGKSKRPFLEKYYHFLQIGTQTSQETVFDSLTKFYPAGTRFTVLTLNMDLMGAGESPMKYEGQLMDVINVRSKYPDTCLPFLCLDPRMGDENFLLDFTKKYINMGYVGIKLYPALGFYPFDQRLDKVYAYAEQKKIPIMTHCTRTGIYYNGDISNEMLNPVINYPSPNPLPGNFKYQTFPVAKMKKNEEFCDYFLDPLNYNYILTKYPKLKICFAHYGGAAEMHAYRKEEKNFTWYNAIQLLMENYDNVYTDVSYTLYDKSLFAMIEKDINDPKYKNKILFGTDYFMTEQEANESVLAMALKDFLCKNNPGNFVQIANHNAVNYLSSDFYIAPN